jgi:hypothetical protein
MPITGKHWIKEQNKTPEKTKHIQLFTAERRPN